MRKVELGRFTNISGNLIICDPCYDKGDGYLNATLPCVKGLWLASIVREGWNGNPVELRARYVKSTPAKWELICGLPVDSGQMCLYDESLYPEGNTGDWDDDKTLDPTVSFYSACCNTTIGPHRVDSQIANFTLTMYRDIQEDHKGPNWKYDEEKVKEAEKVLALSREYPKAGIFTHGVVSSTNYGDGYYPCSVRKDENGLVMAVKVTFLNRKEW